MGRHNIEKDKTAAHWLQQFRGNTRQKYAWRLTKFCDFAKKTPTELFEIRKDEIRCAMPPTESKIIQLVLKFREAQLKKGLSVTSVKAYEDGIRSFFTWTTGYELKGLRSLQNGRPIKTDYVPTPEEFAKILLATDIYNRFRLSFCADTGMRPEDAVRVEYWQIKDEFEAGKIPVLVKEYYPQKDNPGIRITFMGENSIKCLKDLMARGIKFDDNDKLFKTRQSKSISPDRLNAAYQEAVKRAKIKTSRYWVRLYNLRKYFRTLTRAGYLSDRDVSWMMGHVEIVDDMYNPRKNPGGIDDLREKYIKSYYVINPIQKPETSAVGTINNELINQHLQNLANELVNIMRLSATQGFEKTRKELISTLPRIKAKEGELKPVPLIILEAMENAS